MKKIFNKQGFSYLDVLMGMAIFSISVISLMIIFNRVISGNEEIEQKNNAFIILNNTVERIKNIRDSANLEGENDARYVWNKNAGWDEVPVTVQNDSFYQLNWTYNIVYSNNQLLFNDSSEPRYIPKVRNSISWWNSISNYNFAVAEDNIAGIIWDANWCERTNQCYRLTIEAQTPDANNFSLPEEDVENMKLFILTITYNTDDKIEEYSLNFLISSSEQTIF